MCSWCKDLSSSLPVLGFPLWSLTERGQWHWLGHCLLAASWQSEAPWVSLLSIVIAEKKERFQLVCIKTHSASFLFASRTRNPTNSKWSLSTIPSREPVPPSPAPSPLTPPIPIPLSPGPGFSLSPLPHSESQMTAPKHPLPSHSTRASFPLSPAPVALGTNAHHIDRWSQPWPLSSPVGTPRESTPD